MAKSDSDGDRVLSVVELAEILERAPSVWLTAQDVAAITGLTTHWLAAAREGRKAQAGPPYTKIGAGRTAPVRYQAGPLRDWMSAWPQASNTSGAKYESHADYMARATPTEAWLYVEHPSELLRVPIHESISAQLLGAPGTRLAWVAKRDADTWPCRARLSADVLHQLGATVAGDISSVLLNLVNQGQIRR